MKIIYNLLTIFLWITIIGSAFVFAKSVAMYPVITLPVIIGTLASTAITPLIVWSIRFLIKKNIQQSLPDDSLTTSQEDTTTGGHLNSDKGALINPQMKSKDDDEHSVLETKPTNSFNISAIWIFPIVGIIGIGVLIFAPFQKSVSSGDSSTVEEKTLLPHSVPEAVTKQDTVIEKLPIIQFEKGFFFGMSIPAWNKSIAELTKKGLYSELSEYDGIYSVLKQFGAINGDIKMRISPSFSYVHPSNDGTITLFKINGNITESYLNKLSYDFTPATDKFVCKFLNNLIQTHSLSYKLGQRAFLPIDTEPTLNSLNLYADLDEKVKTQYRELGNTSEEDNTTKKQVHLRTTVLENGEIYVILNLTTELLVNGIISQSRVIQMDSYYYSHQLKLEIIPKAYYKGDINQFATYE